MSEGKKGRGRPEINNDEILKKILSDDKLIADFKNDVRQIQDAILLVSGANETLKSRLTYVSEATGLSKKFLKDFVNSLKAGSLGEELAEAEAKMSLAESVQFDLF